MVKSARYHPLFDVDVIEAANWYDERSAGLGDAFATNVERTVMEILSDPTRFAIAKYQLRYHRVKRFPFIVLFDIVGAELLFSGFFIRRVQLKNGNMVVCHSVISELILYGLASVVSFIRYSGSKR